MLNVVCVRVGERYGPEYVAILYDMVTRNLGREFRFWCLTDRPHELPEGVNPIPAPDGLPGWWAKIALFSPDKMPWGPGERIVYFDLDVAITGRLDELVDTPGIIRDWNLPGYNSSVMVWDAGDHASASLRFTPDVMQRLHGDQDWLAELGGWELFPRAWCVSYRAHAQDWPPEGSAVVCFHGEPKPPQCAGWVPGVWKIGGMSALPKLDGMNVSYATALDNMRANCARDLPWFTGFPHKDVPVCVVGGGPSLKDTVEDLRRLHRAGAKVVSTNNAMAWLIDHGITPDVHVILDARPENAAFVQNPPRSVRYFIASQCDPAVFDALKRRQVVVWHAAICDESSEIVRPWDKTRPICMVGGGGTVGLRTLNLCWLSGYREVHVFGMDSSYAETHHAYPQALNDTETTVQVTLNGKTYRSAVWMARQAEEFKDAWRHLAAQGVRLRVHGSGLIPDMARVLEQLERAA